MHLSETFGGVKAFTNNPPSLGHTVAWICQEKRLHFLNNRIAYEALTREPCGALAAELPRSLRVDEVGRRIGSGRVQLLALIPCSPLVAGLPLPTYGTETRRIYQRHVKQQLHRRPAFFC
jgi:hypothetical protein